MSSKAKWIHVSKKACSSQILFLLRWENQIKVLTRGLLHRWASTIKTLKGAVCSHSSEEAYSHAASQPQTTCNQQIQDLHIGWDRPARNHLREAHLQDRRPHQGFKLPAGCRCCWIEWENTHSVSHCTGQMVMSALWTVLPYGGGVLVWAAHDSLRYRDQTRGSLLSHWSTNFTSCCGVMVLRSLHNSQKLKTSQFLHDQQTHRSCDPLSRFMMLWIGVCCSSCQMSRTERRRVDQQSTVSSLLGSMSADVLHRVRPEVVTWRTLPGTKNQNGG